MLSLPSRFRNILTEFPKGLNLVDANVLVPEFWPEGEMDLRDLTEEQVAALAVAACTDIRALLVLVWKVIQPNTPLMWSFHLDIICWAMKQLYDLNIVGNILVINVPPRSTKSILANVVWVCYLWLNNPASEVLCLTDIQPTLTRDAVQCREFMSSDYFKMIFEAMKKLYPERRLQDFDFKDDLNVKTNFANTQGGARVASLVFGKYTGTNGSHIVLDDCTDAVKIYKSGVSVAEVDEALTAIRVQYDNTIRARMRDKKRGTTLVTAQRLDDNDLPDYLIKEYGASYIVLPLCFEANHERRCELDPRTEEGQVLNPELWDKVSIDQERKHGKKWHYMLQNKSGYSGENDLFFMMDRIEYVNLSVEEFKKQAGPDAYWIATWDTSSSLEARAKYTVAVVCCVVGKAIYPVKIWRAKANTVIALEMYDEVEAEFGRLLLAHLIEGNHTGKAILDLKGKPSYNICVKTGLDSKAKRAGLFQTWVEYRSFIMNHADPNTEACRQEMRKFMNGGLTSDFIDAMSQLCHYVATVLGIDVTKDEEFKQIFDEMLADDAELLFF